MERADGLIIVAPEYNHGYPGLLKHFLDTCLKEYIHKAFTIASGRCGIKIQYIYLLLVIETPYSLCAVFPSNIKTN
jgi:multimeric flavodoxin WrbA